MVARGLLLLVSLLASSGIIADDQVKGSRDVQSFCKKSIVTVSSLILTCDSPGAYYYGSSTYRNSEVCMSNDKANIKLHCKLLG